MKDKYLISDNYMCRYYCNMNYNKITNVKLMYLDYVTIDNPDKMEGLREETSFSLTTTTVSSTLSGTPQLTRSSGSNIYPKQLGLQVFEKTMKPEDFKNINIKDTEILYDDLINYYYDNSFNTRENAQDDEDYSKKTVIREIDLSDPENITDPSKFDRKIITNINMVSNLIAQKGRIGPGNLCILPEKIYKRIGNMMHSDLKTIKNPTNFHHDKIFILRLFNDMSQGGISVMCDYPLSDSRELKLLKIMNRIKKNSTEDKFMNYSIIGTGSNYKYQVGVIYVKD